jgi:group I intron endonuclease
MGEIYGIYSKKHDKIMYVGQTSEGYEKRFKRHIRCSWHKQNTSALYKSIRKYGTDNFIIKCLLECNNDLLNEKEIEYIEKYNTYSKGYNETIGGDGKRGYKHKQSTKNIIGEKLKNRWENDRDTIIESLKKRPPRKQSQEEILWRSEYMKDNNPVNDEKVRNKISKTHKEKYDNGYINPGSFNWKITEPNGKEIITNKLKEYCKDNGLGYSGMYRAYRLQTKYRNHKIEKVGK